MPDLKKIPPWAWAVGAVAIGALFYLYKKHQEQALEAPGAEGEVLPEPEIAGVENPAEEFPYSIGGLGAGGGAGSFAGQEQASQFADFEKANQEFQTASTKQEQEYQKTIAEQIAAGQSALTSLVQGLSGTMSSGSGGGAPTSSTQGTTAAPPAPSAPPAQKCGSGAHAEFPLGTPPDCYRISRTKSGGGCQCHGHQNGKLECQQGYANPKKGQQACHW